MICLFVLGDFNAQFTVLSTSLHCGLFLYIRPHTRLPTGGGEREKEGRKEGAKTHAKKYRPFFPSLLCPVGRGAVASSLFLLLLPSFPSTSSTSGQYFFSPPLLSPHSFCPSLLSLTVWSNMCSRASQGKTIVYFLYFKSPCGTRSFLGSPRLISHLPPSPFSPFTHFLLFAPCKRRRERERMSPPYPLSLLSFNPQKAFSKAAAAQANFPDKKQGHHDRLVFVFHVVSRERGED